MSGILGFIIGLLLFLCFLIVPEVLIFDNVNIQNIIIFYCVYSLIILFIMDRVLLSLFKSKRYVKGNNSQVEKTVDAICRNLAIKKPNIYFYNSSFKNVFVTKGLMGNTIAIEQSLITTLTNKELESILYYQFIKLKNNFWFSNAFYSINFLIIYQIGAILLFPLKLICKLIFRESRVPDFSIIILFFSFPLSKLIEGCFYSPESNLNSKNSILRIKLLLECFNSSSVYLNSAVEKMKSISREPNLHELITQKIFFLYDFNKIDLFWGRIISLK
jgi:Zn-dependent protease with chaperone function